MNTALAYKLFLFDLDRTLWDFDTNAHDAIIDLLGQYQLQERIPDGEAFFRRYEEINALLWNEYEAGRLSQPVLRSLRFEKTLSEFGVEDSNLAARFGAEYLEIMPTKHALMPHAREVLDALQAKGKEMVIISNGFKQVQRLKLAGSGIDQYFSRLFISEEVGVHKPNPLIFRAAVTACNAKKKDCLMVGDDFAKDMEGAQVFGIDQFFYNYKNLPCEGGPTYMSSDLRDLIPLA